MIKTLEETCNNIDLQILIIWLRMAKRELVIEDGKITEVNHVKES